MEAWPIDSTKRSRLGQIGSSGSKRRKRCHRQYTTGASAIGVPGWPELAACTASIDSVRMVLMASFSIGVVSVDTVRPAARGMGATPGIGIEDRGTRIEERGSRIAKMIYRFALADQ